VEKGGYSGTQVLQNCFEEKIKKIEKDKEKDPPYLNFKEKCLEANVLQTFKKKLANF